MRQCALVLAASVLVVLLGCSSEPDYSHLPECNAAQTNAPCRNTRPDGAYRMDPAGDTCDGRVVNGWCYPR